MITNTNCPYAGQCPHSEYAINIKMNGFGATDPKLLIISESPSVEEDQKNQLFSNQAGTFLKLALNELKFDASVIHLTSLIRCTPYASPARRETMKPEQVAIDHCKNHLLYDISTYENLEVILAIGDAPYRYFFPDAKDGIVAASGEVLTYTFPSGKKVQVMPLVSPNYIFRNPGKKKFFNQCLAKLKSLVEGTAVSLPAEFLKADQFEEYARMLLSEYAQGNLDYITFDIETNSLENVNYLIHPISEVYLDGDPISMSWLEKNLGKYITIYNKKKNPIKGKLVEIQRESGKIKLLKSVVIGFSLADKITRKGYFVALDHKDNPDEAGKEKVRYYLSMILNTIPLVCHNAKFDLKWAITHLGMDETRYTLRDDTMLMAFSIYNKESGFTLRLKDLCRMFAGVVENWEETLHEELSKIRKVEDRNFGSIPLDVLSPYAGKDAMATLVLYEYLTPIIKEKKQEYLQEILKEMTKLFIELENKGIPISPQILDIASKYRDQKDQAVIQINDMAIVKKYKEAFQTDEFNPASSQQVGKILFDRDYFNLEVIKQTDKGAPSCDSGTIDELLVKYKGSVVKRDAYTFLKAFKKFKELNSVITKYLDKLSLALDNNYRYIPDFNVTATATGRLGSFIHLMPRNYKDIKRLIVGDYLEEGGLTAAFDFSQVEVRVMAALADEATLRQAYIDGADVHRRVAATINNIPAEMVNPEQRSRAKQIVFGALYGSSSYSIAEAIGSSVEEAQRILDFFFKGFPNLRGWIAKIQQFCRQNGHVVTEFGRIRFFPDINSPDKKNKAAAERGCYNTIIQSTASDLTLTSLMGINKYIKDNNLKSRIISTVHDSIVISIHPQEIVPMLKAIHWNMTDRINQSYSWLAGVPIAADGSIGMSWGSAMEYSWKGNQITLKGYEADLEELKTQFAKAGHTFNILSVDFVEEAAQEDLEFEQVVKLGKKVKVKAETNLIYE